MDNFNNRSEASSMFFFQLNRGLLVLAGEIKLNHIKTHIMLKPTPTNPTPFSSGKHMKYNVVPCQIFFLSSIDIHGFWLKS